MTPRPPTLAELARASRRRPLPLRDPPLLLPPWLLALLALAWGVLIAWVLP